MPSSSQLRICRKVAWCVPAVDLHMACCNASRCSLGAVIFSLCRRCSLAICSRRYEGQRENTKAGKPGSLLLALLPVTSCGSDAAVPGEYFAWTRMGGCREQSALQMSHLLLCPCCCPLPPPSTCELSTCMYVESLLLSLISGKELVTGEMAFYTAKILGFHSARNCFYHGFLAAQFSVIPSCVLVVFGHHKFKSKALTGFLHEACPNFCTKYLGNHKVLLRGISQKNMISWTCAWNLHSCEVTTRRWQRQESML